MFYQKRKMKKRAQGLSINAIILIILAVAVLVVLILGFVLGWGKIFPWFGPKNDNIQTVVSACESACTQQEVYSYCTSNRTLEARDKALYDVTCYTLSSDINVFDIYGVESCPGLNCKSLIRCDEWIYFDESSKKK